MFAFIVRRLLIAIPILLLSSFLVFMLVAASGDPLEDLRLRPGVQQSVIDQPASTSSGLDKPVLQRYWDWLTNFVHGDFGKNLKGQEVRPQLTRALGLTLRLVLISTDPRRVPRPGRGGDQCRAPVHARSTTRPTFISFLFFAMPVFWFAVLLKEFGAIKLNACIVELGPQDLHDRLREHAASRTAS